jgi:hypothetical protein
METTTEATEAGETVQPGESALPAAQPAPAEAQAAPPLPPLEVKWDAEEGALLADRLKQAAAEAKLAAENLQGALKDAQEEGGVLRAFVVGAAWTAGALLAGIVLNEVATAVAARLRPPAPLLRRVDSPADSSTPEAA